jgi:hypothetical protein
MWSASSRAVQQQAPILQRQLSLQKSNKMDRYWPEVHLLENHLRHRRHPQQWAISAGNMETLIKMQQNHIPRSARTTSGELCRSNMWLLDHKLNAANRLLLRRQHHQVQGRELVQVAKARSKFLQASKRGGSSQRTSPCLWNPKVDGHRVHVSNKAWPHHPDLDENHLGLFPMLTTSQHTHHLLSPLLDRTLAAR